MELLQLKYFCDAAESENFSRTAEKYKVPTSNISQTVKRLEDELGVKLFRRSPNRVTLSKEGRIFYDGAKRALNYLDCAKRSLTDPDGELGGEIRLLIRAHRRTSTLAVEKFKKLYPKVQISINHDTDAVYSDYDFIISDGAERRAGYTRELLLTENIVLAVESKHPLASRKEVELSELSEESFVSMAKSSRLTELTSAICRAAGFSPKVVISAEDPYYVRKYVEMGMGIALVPSISWRGMFSENTVFLNLGDHKREIYLYTFKDKSESKAERVFADIIRSTFEDEGSLNTK
ncbi:MAG: LysR family transcriptional regulator [Clostridia bacterium]|nr:LysR family transcriptional regulator [Clostridia bacterium]